MEVHLTPQHEAFIQQEVSAGRFASQDDAMRAAVELLQEREGELGKLRAGVDEGDDDIAHGRYTEYSDRTLPQLSEDLKREARVVRDERAGSTR